MKKTALHVNESAAHAEFHQLQIETVKLQSFLNEFDAFKLFAPLNKDELQELIRVGCKQYVSDRIEREIELPSVGIFIKLSRKKAAALVELPDLTSCEQQINECQTHPRMFDYFKVKDGKITILSNAQAKITEQHTIYARVPEQVELAELQKEITEKLNRANELSILCYNRLITPHNMDGFTRFNVQSNEYIYRSDFHARPVQTSDDSGN